MSERLGTSLYLRAQDNAAQDVNPSVARRDAQLRRSSGIQLESFDDVARAVAEARERQTRAASALQRAPELGPVLADPHRYQRAADDLDSLADISEAIRRAREAQIRPPSFQARLRANVASYGTGGYSLAALQSLRDVVSSAGSWAGEALAGLAQGTLETLRYSPLAALTGTELTVGGVHVKYDPTGGRYENLVSGARNIGDYYSRARRSSAVDYGNEYANAAVRGVESVPTQLVALVAAARGQPQAGIALLSSLTGGTSYREARQAGLPIPRALTYAATDAGLEAVGEALPLGRFAHDVAAGTGFVRTLGRQLVAENIGEQVTNHLQDFNQWASIEANRGKSFAEFLQERPRAFIDTMIATTAAVGLQTTGAFGVNRAVERFEENRYSRIAQRNVDRIMDAAGGSRLRQESPEDFQGILAEQLLGRPGENLYIPAAAVRSLFQSSEDMSADSFWGDHAAQITEAEALGGDVVVPLAAAATHLAGTPQWEAIKDQVRSTPGGMSRVEADEWETAFEDAVRQTGEQLAAQHEEERARMEPVEKVFEAMRDKLMLAGFRPDAANQLATTFAQRQRVRAERLGRELTGEEAGTVEIRQVMPERLAAVIRAAEIPDAGLREVIAEMKRGRGERSEKTRLGPSLIDWIVSQGGIEDKGGDIKAMGAIQIKKGRAKKGQRRLILAHDPDQAQLIEVGKQNTNTPDELALRAWEEGYFPEFTERPTVNDLLDAISEGLAGRDRFVPGEANEADQLRAAAQELFEILDQEGVDQATASQQEIMRALSRFQAARTEGRGFEQLFEEPIQPARTMTPEQRAELEARQQQSKARRGGQESVKDQEGGLFSAERDQRSLFQSFMEGPRGRITFTEDGRSVIDLFEARDLSTFIHESGHLYLEELKTDAELALQIDTPEGRQLFADWEAVKAWFKREGHEIGEDGQIPTEAHELWARGFERFAMEGRAPSSILRRPFEAFRSWLLTIYKVVNNLRAPITPEIRDVMNRLLATDEEIAAAAEEQEIKALFKTAEEAGMTAQEFAAYRTSTEEARGEAYDALLYRTMASIRAQRTQEHKEREASVRADAATQIDAKPIFRALRLLRTGRIADEAARNIKLDKQWLIETYGEDALDAMPRSVPPIYAAKGTVHPDQIAEELDFSSGDELVRTLMGHEQARQELRANGDKRSPRQVEIDEMVADRMAERYGDPLRDGSIEEEARALIHNDRQGEVIASEIRALARRSNKRPTPYSIAKRWAADKIAKGRVSEMVSGNALQQYQRAARRAGKAAQEAMLKGDVDETFRQKQAQMLNNALISEAKKAKDRVDVAVRRLGRIARRRQMASVDQDYLDQAHQLLEQVDFATRSQRSIDKQKSFEAWHAEQTKAGHDVVVPEHFAFSLGTTHWSRLSVEELIGLDDTVQQIMHLGRLKQTLLDGQERRSFEEIIAEAQAAAARLPPKPPSDLMEPSFGERLKHYAASFDSALLKTETLIDWLDSGDPNGVFNRIVFKPIAEAQGRAGDMFADYVGQLNEALAKVPRKRLARWGDHVTAPELLNPETGNPFVLTRQQLISMALNMGNEGNAQRLADGYRWSEPNVLAVLNRELTAEEWTYVQDVWDIVNSLWPQIEELEKRVNGLPPEKVPARPVETSIGTLAGGYFPVVYDTRRDYSAEKNAARETDLFETRYTRATTRASATKERAEEVKRPILLNLGVITRHVGEVIHDITHREAVMNADKFLSSRRVMKAIDETLGPEMRGQFRPWLKFVANQWAMERAGNEGVGAFINKLRTNATVVGLGFRFTTVMMQIGGYSNSFEAVGPTWVGQALAQTSAHPVETFRFVMNRSAEMRHRMDTLDRDIDAGIKRLAGKFGGITAATRFAFHGIGYADRLVVIPTWLGAYNKALSQGMEDQEAVYAADKAVRQSQGAGAAKDLAAVQRGSGKWGQALKLMTMFYAYPSAVYQRQRTLGRDVRNISSPRELPAIMARAWWLIVVPPLLSEILAGRGPGAGGPDDDEDWGWWAFKNMLFQSLGAIPVIRDLARPVWDKVRGAHAFDYQLSPMQRSGQSLVNVAGDVGRVSRGEDTRHATRDVLEAAGYWTGLVPGQFAQSAQFLVDVSRGDADPETANDWFRGVTTGRMPEN